MPSWAFNGGFCACTVSTKISCAGPFFKYFFFRIYETIHSSKQTVSLSEDGSSLILEEGMFIMHKVVLQPFVF